MAMGGGLLTLRVLSLVSGVILARLLDPIDFGLVALAQIVLNVVGMTAPLGLGAALIQRPTERAASAFHVFLVSVVSGSGFFLATFLSAEVLSGLLGNTHLTPILQWMSVSILIRAIARTPEALMEKDMLFTRLSLIMVVAEVTYIAVAISMAVAGAGVWSLVYAILLQAIVQASMSWMMCQDKTWLKLVPWDWSLLRQLFRYGMKSVASRAVYFFYSNADNFIVGKMLGPQVLGYYSKAFDLTSKTVDNVHRAVGVVLFPSYSKIQSEVKRLTNAYLKSLKMLSLLTVPMAVGILILAPEIVGGLLGKKWLPMIPIIEVLALMSIVKPLSSTTSALFQSTGHPGYNFRAGIVVTVLMIPGIFLLLPSGAVGVALAVFISHVAGLGYNVYQVQTILPRTAIRMAKAITPAAAGSCLMAGGMWLTRLALTEVFNVVSPVAILLVLFLVGVGIYGAFVLSSQHAAVNEIMEILRKKRKGTPKGEDVVSGSDGSQ